MLPVLQDESDLLLDEASESLEAPGVEILGQDVEDGVASPEDGLPQLPGLVKLLLQLVSPLQLESLQEENNVRPRHTVTTSHQTECQQHSIVKLLNSILITAILPIFCEVKINSFSFNASTSL